MFLFYDIVAPIAVCVVFFSFFLCFPPEVLLIVIFQSRFIGAYPVNADLHCGGTYLNLNASCPGKAGRRTNTEHTRMSTEMEHTANVIFSHQAWVSGEDGVSGPPKST